MKFITIIIVCISSIFLGCELSGEKHNEEVEHFPNDWFYTQRAYPYETIDMASYTMAYNQAKQIKNNSFRQRLPIWQLSGPTNIEGRISDIEMNPADSKQIFIGAASGGVFRTTDNGKTWSPIFDNAENLSIGDIAISNSNPKIVYVGTGEANCGGGSTTYDGLGVYKSFDYGISWQQTGLKNSGNIGKIVIDPTNENLVYVAAMGNLYANNAERGVFKTQDGGKSWEKVLFVSDSTGAIDIIINPKNPKQVFASTWERVRRINRRTYGGKTSAIYKSEDEGKSWTELVNGLPVKSSNNGRIGLSMSQQDPKIIYAVYADQVGYFSGLYKTIDGGNNWNRLNDAVLTDVFASYGWWFGHVQVDPNNDDIVYVIGYDTYKSEDGGLTWNNITTSIHVDHHKLVIANGNSNVLMLATDGGLYTSLNGGSSWIHNAKIPITQFYSCAIDAQYPKRLYGGAQDNNVIRTITGNMNDWKSIIGGDGLEVLVDPNHSNIIYAESQYGALKRSKDNGIHFEEVDPLVSEQKNWKTPIILNPLNSNGIFFGAQKIYYSNDQATNWSAISPDLPNRTTGNNLGTITCIGISKVDSLIIFAGTDDGNVWCTKDGGKLWNKVSSTLPNRWVTRIAVGDIPGIAYMALSGYRKFDYLPHIFKTTDFGNNWTDISGNLPEAPVNDIIIDPSDSNHIFIATDFGVYQKTKSSMWSIVGDSLPNVPITDIEFNQNTNTLIAATYGRSMYTVYLNQFTSVVNQTKEKIELTIQPNFVSDKTKIICLMKKDGLAVINLYNLKGNIINKIYAGQLSSGQHEFIWQNEKNVPAGIYMMILKTNSDVVVEKLIISE